jgi:hypothetical protein
MSRRDRAAGRPAPTGERCKVNHVLPQNDGTSRRNVTACLDCYRLLGAVPYAACPAACRFSLRDATASVARRHQWQTMPIEAPKSLEAVQLDRDSVRAYANGLSPAIRAAACVHACMHACNVGTPMHASWRQQQQYLQLWHRSTAAEVQWQMR